MGVPEKIIALLDSMTIASLDRMAPVQRLQFAHLCRHWADLATRPRPAPTAGVLSDLHDRRQA